MNDISKEKELVHLLKEGDGQAFQQLYVLYSKRLSGYLLKLVKSETLAAELLQDVFVKVWNNRHHLDPEQSFSPYLFKIAKNGVFDFFRKAERDKRLQSELIKAANIHYQHVEEDLSVKENARLLEQAINELPPKRRNIYQLIKVEERSYDEVSSLLAISTSTISDHIVKATKAIRGKMNAWSDAIIIIFILLHI